MDVSAVTCVHPVVFYPGKNNKAVLFSNQVMEHILFRELEVRRT